MAYKHLDRKTRLSPAGTVTAKPRAAISSDGVRGAPSI